MNKRLKILLPDNIKTDLPFQGKQFSSCLNIKDNTSFGINMIWFTMLNVLKKVVTMTMSKKQQETSLRG